MATSPRNLTLCPLPSETPHLSPRQLDIMHYVAKGFNNAEIATAPGVGRDCVKANLKIAFSRLGAASRSEAVVIALKKNLLKV